MNFFVRKLSDTVTPSLRGIINAINGNNRRMLLRDLATEFLRVTRANFGNTGEDREKPWAKLSKPYARKVNRSYATLINRGELMNSIKIMIPTRDEIEIYTTNKYAAAQAFGYTQRNLPSRNFFPIENAGGGPNTGARLTKKTDKKMQNILSTRLNILSGGALPRITNSMQRMEMSYGDVFTGL